jgi:hypothetical protein
LNEIHDHAININYHKSKPDRDRSASIALSGEFLIAWRGKNLPRVEPLNRMKVSGARVGRATEGKTIARFISATLGIVLSLAMNYRI